MHFQFEPCIYWELTYVEVISILRLSKSFFAENMIGKGGYAEVYEGCMDGQFVAIKKLIQGTSMEQTNDFLSELGILVHLDHPNTTKLIGFGIEEGLHLVLQLSEYGNLSSFLHGN